MPKLELDGTMWYGFDKDSKNVAISHSELCEWAKPRGCFKEIDCSSAVVLPDRTRLVRGSKAIRLAEEHSWGDIAMALGDEVTASVKAGL